MDWGAVMVALVAAGAAAATRPAGAVAQATADRPRLTRRQAVDSALAHNPALAAAREQVAEARARAVQTAAFPDPFLSADVTGQTGVLDPGSGTGHDLGVGLSVPFPTKFHLRGVVGRSDVQAAEFAWQQLREQTASQTAQAYDALLVAQRHRADLEEGRGLAQDFLDKTRARYAGGTVPALDTLKARVDLAQADNDLIANQRALANAQAGLDRLMGRLLGAALEPADTLEVPPPLPDLAVLEDTAQALRPELRGLASQRAGAAAATSLARAWWTPDLSVSVTRNATQGSASTWTTGLGVSVPLFFWNHSRGEVAEASHREQELAASYRDLQAQVDQDVRTTFAAAETALRQALFLRDELLPEAARAYRIALVSYGLGGASTLDVLDARRTLLDAQGQYADALGAAADARADLERAVGRPLDTLPAGGAHAR